MHDSSTPAHAGRHVPFKQEGWGIALFICLLALASALTAYTVGTNGTGLILKTINGGASWSPQTSNSAQTLNDVWFVDTQRGWAVGDGGRIVHTSRGGQ